MRAETIAQFKILQFLNEHFEVDILSIKLVNDYTIEITDCDAEKAKLEYLHNEVVLKSIEK